MPWRMLDERLTRHQAELLARCDRLADDLQLLAAQVREILAAQAELGRTLASVQSWTVRHEEHHGLHPEKRPWIWVANSTSWAWHHPGRTLAAAMAVGALAAPPIRAWLGANLPHLARWALGGI